nr:Chain C, HIV-P24 [Human immunodeficiency virus]
ISPRTLDAW